MRKSTIFLLMLLGVVLWYKKGMFLPASGGIGGAAPSGMAAPEDPVQSKAKNVQPIPYKDYIITPLYSYSVTALVLSKKKYSTDRESELSPYDLALGWGPLSSDYTLKHMKIWQSGRWYRYRYEASFPTSPKKIIRNSANTHIIPADDNVLKMLKDVDKYDTVSMEGYLVSVRAKSGNWHWRSSTTRGDTGDGSCELFYVTSLRIH